MSWKAAASPSCSLHDDIEIFDVGTGADALDALRTQSFDCCVLDLRLPDMSGFELLDQVKADPTLGNVPIVVFTGKDLSTEEERRAQSGGQERRVEGRPVARTAVRRDGPVPAPRGRGFAANPSSNSWSACTNPTSRCAVRKSSWWTMTRAIFSP